MPAGTYYAVDTGRTYNTYYGGNFTTTSGITMPQRGVLKSIMTRFTAAGTWNGSIVIYRQDTQSRVYLSGQAANVTVNANNVDTEITLPNPPMLEANVIYDIGFYTSSSSSVFPGALNIGSGTLTTTPSGFTVNVGGPYYNRYVSGDGYPTNGTTSYTAWRGLYFDIPNIPPSVSIINQTINPLANSRVSWTYSDPNSNTQTKYEILYKEQGSENGWTLVTADSANAYHDFPVSTFEENKVYSVSVRAYDGADWSTRASSIITTTQFTELTSVTSSSTTGIIDAASFIPGDYEVEVRVADESGFGPWSAPQTFTLSPASNVQVRQAGTWKTGIEYVKKNGIWVQASPTKRKSGGVFV